MAGLQIRAYVNGNQEFIELFGNESINMDISFAEIQDITKKNSAFSQEFKCPGSKNNNYIFNYFFDINSVGLDWNPKKKFEADLLYDGYEIYNGYVRMNSVTINKIEKTYSITFYASVGDLVANIGDKGLCELNTSEIDYPSSAVTVDNSWLSDGDFNDLSLVKDNNPGRLPFLDMSISVNNKDVELMLAQKGYDYTGSTNGTILDIDTANTPILSFSGVPGFFDYYDPEIILDPLKSNAVNIAYLIPSVRVPKLYEMICNQAGYQIESQFFQTSYFRRMYLPLSFNTESVYINQARTMVYESFNNIGINNPVGYRNENAILKTTLNTNINADFFKVGDVIFDSFDYNPITSTTFPLLRNMYDCFIKVPQTVYNYSITFDVVYTGASTNVNQLVNMGKMYLGTFDGWDVGDDLEIGLLVSANTRGNRFRTGNVDTQTITGTTPSYRFSTSFLGFNYLTLFVDEVSSGFTINDISITLSGTSVSLPEEIILSREMSCDIKQVDVIQNINKMYNLVVVPHPIKPKTLIVEPMVNYIGKGETIDWTDKVDFNSPLTLTPTTSVINGSLFFANRPDKDLINVEYTKSNNRIFGQNIINLGEDYKNEQTDMSQKVLAQNTDYYLNASGNTNVALPCFFISKQNNKDGQAIFEYRPFRSLPRVTFKGIPINNEQLSQNPWYYRYSETATAIGTFQNYNRFTTYPFGLSGFSHYLTYDATNRYTDDELIFPTADTLYDVFYRDYIEDLTSEENKILNCKMYLQPWEVSQLYFNETIVVKNARWRINKITNLSLLGPGMCDVELVKLTRDYTDFPIKFYDLIPCGGTGDTIHTHTDLNYHIYGMVGSIVRAVPYPYTLSDSGPFFIDAQNYTVTEVEFNPSYFYQKPYFEDGFIVPSLGQDIQYKNYFLFEGACSGETTLIYTLPIYSDLPTEGGPSVDGQPYDPTPPPPPTSNCNSYTAFLATGQGNFFYYDCNGVYTVGTVGPSQGGPTSVTFCALEGSVSGRQPTFVNNGPCV